MVFFYNRCEVREVASLQGVGSIENYSFWLVGKLLAQTLHLFLFHLAEDDEAEVSHECVQIR